MCHPLRGCSPSVVCHQNHVGPRRAGSERQEAGQSESNKLTAGVGSGLSSWTDEETEAQGPAGVGSWSPLGHTHRLCLFHLPPRSCCSNPELSAPLHPGSLTISEHPPRRTPWKSPCTAVVRSPVLSSVHCTQRGHHSCVWVSCPVFLSLRPGRAAAPE